MRMPTWSSCLRDKNSGWRKNKEQVNGNTQPWLQEKHKKAESADTGWVNTTVERVGEESAEMRQGPQGVPEILEDGVRVVSPEAKQWELPGGTRQLEMITQTAVAPCSEA